MTDDQPRTINEWMRRVERRISLQERRGRTGVNRMKWVEPTNLSPVMSASTLNYRYIGMAKDSQGLVHLRGLFILALSILPNTNTTLWVLPRDMWPAMSERFPCANSGTGSGAIPQLLIEVRDSTGAVNLLNRSSVATPNPSTFSLGHIIFDPDAGLS